MMPKRQPGRPRLADMTSNFTFRHTPEARRLLEASAKRRGISLTQEVGRRLLWTFERDALPCAALERKMAFWAETLAEMDPHTSDIFSEVA